MFGSSSGAPCTCCRPCSIVTKLSLTLKGLDRYQEVVVVEAQMPPDGDVQEAHLPVGPVDIGDL